MMFKSKKGIVYHMGLALVVFVILISAFSILQNKKNKFDGVLGEAQFQLIKQYQDVENSLFLLDTSAKFKLSESVAHLARYGGFDDLSDCGQKGVRINVWVDRGKSNAEIKECYPFEEVEDLSKTLLGHNKKLWESFPEGLLPKLDELKINNKDDSMEFLYIAKEKSSINLVSKADADSQSKLLGKYNFYPSFRINFPYSFNEYELAKDLVKKIIEKCSDKEDDFECVFSQAVDDRKFLGEDCKKAEATSSISRFYKVCLKSEYNTFHGVPDLKLAFYLPDLKKPELDLVGVLTGGILNADTILNQVGGNELYVSLLDKFEENPVFETYTSLKSGDIFAIPDYNPDSIYNFAVKAITPEGNEYVYTIASKKDTVVINDGSVSGLSFEDMNR